jgi:hypothetical protein
MVMLQALPYPVLNEEQKLEAQQEALKDRMAKYLATIW